MLEHVLDNKEVLLNYDIVDLSDTIFKRDDYESMVFNIYKVPESMKMRIDLVSIAAYGTDKYADLLMKYNNISNPFTLNTDDILFIPTLDTIENELKPVTTKSSSMAEKIRNYHKYIDKNKLPVNIGSENNDKTIKKSEYKEANMAPVNQNGITMRNGRIYFGENADCECAIDGDTIGNFLVSKIENAL